MTFSQFLRIAAVLFVAGLLLSSCMGYQPQSRVFGVAVGSGYDDVQLSPNTWRVSYSSDAEDYLDSRIRDYAMLRAAWLCHQSGYNWFTVNAVKERGYVTRSDDGYTYSMLVSGFKNEFPGALNSAFILSSLSQKYRVSTADLQR